MALAIWAVQPLKLLNARAAPASNPKVIAHLTEEPRPPQALAPSLGAPLSRAVLRALAKNPQARPSLMMVREWLGILREAHTAPP